MTTTNFIDKQTVIVADWLNDVDAHTYDQETTAHQATKINFNLNETGSINRTVKEKLGDVVSVKDFGAVGDGVTDDTEAIQKAFMYGLNNNKSVYIPKGIYIAKSQIKTVCTDREKNKLDIFGDGATIYSQIPDTETTFAIEFSGSEVTKDIVLSSSVDKGATYLFDEQLSFLKAGDVLRLRSNRLIRTDHRSHWKQGQAFEVKSVEDRYIHLSDPTEIDVPVNYTDYTILPDNGDNKNTTSYFLINLSSVTGGNNDDSMRYPMYCISGNNLGQHRNATSLSIKNNRVYFQTGWGDNTFQDDNRTPWPNVPNAGDVYRITRTASVDAYIPIKVNISGVFITRDKLVDRTSESHLAPQGVNIVYGLNCKIHDCKVSNFPMTGINFDTCVNCEAYNCDVSYANMIYDGVDGTGHGFDLSGANLYIHDCNIQECRSGITTSDKYIYTTNCICDNINISSGNFKNPFGEHVFPNDKVNTPYGFGGHGDLFNCIFRNITVKDCYYGTSLRGEGIFIENCSFIGKMYAAIMTSLFKDLSVSNSIMSAESKYGSVFASINTNKSNDEGYIRFIGNSAHNCADRFINWNNIYKDAKQVTCIGNQAFYDETSTTQRLFSIRELTSEEDAILEGLKETSFLISESSFIDNSMHYIGNSPRMDAVYVINKSMVAPNSWLQVSRNMFKCRIKSRSQCVIPANYIYDKTGGLLFWCNILGSGFISRGIIYDIQNDLSLSSIVIEGEDYLHISSSASDVVDGKVNLYMSGGAFTIKNRFDEEKSIIVKFCEF